MFFLSFMFWSRTLWRSKHTPEREAQYQRIKHFSSTTGAFLFGFRGRNHVDVEPHAKGWRDFLEPLYNLGVSCEPHVFPAAPEDLDGAAGPALRKFAGKDSR
jgi:hypothetical protein